MAGAFQSSAFQASAFQTGAAVASGVVGGGGFLHGLHRRRTAEDVKHERIRLGIIKPDAKKVARVIRIEAQPEQPQEFVWPAELQARFEQEQALLALQAQQERAQAQEQYMRAVRLQAELALQQQEEEQIIRLLMEM